MAGEYDFSTLFGDGGGLLDTTQSTAFGAPGIDFKEFSGLSTPTLPVSTDVEPGGFSKFLSNLGSGITKSFETDPLGAIGKTLGLGTSVLGGYEAIKGGKLASQEADRRLKAQRQMLQIAQPAAAAAATLVPGGTAALMGGPLPPGLQDQVNQFKSDARQRLRSFFSHAGITDSTMMSSLESQIDTQALILQEQLAQSLFQAGTTATTAALGPLSGVESSSERGIASANQSVQNAYKSLGILFGQ